MEVTGEVRPARLWMGFLASQQKTAGEWCREGTPIRMAQRISTTLQRANARAILRRLGVKPTAADGDTDLERLFSELQ